MPGRDVSESVVSADRQGAWVIWALAFLTLMAALASRVGILHWPANFDEYYHYLAARSWIENGTLGILDGTYSRGAGYTKAVAWVMQATDDTTLSGARMLGVALGALIPVVILLWVTRAVGLLAGGVAALLTLLWPQGIEEAQTVRFYVVQVLGFLVALVAFYSACGAGILRRLLWLGIGALGIVVASLMQVSTIVGVAGLLLWWGLTCLWPRLRAHPWRWPLGGAGLAVGLSAVALGYAQGWLTQLWDFYRWVPAHAQAHRDDVLYYVRDLTRVYGLFWLGVPFVVWLALRAHRRLAIYCLCVFAVALIVHSFGAFKAGRYLSYVMPCYFVLLALALAEALHWAKHRFVSVAGGVVSAIFVVAVVAVASTGSFARHSLWLAKGPDGHGRRDWSGMAALLDDWAQVPYRVTIFELHTIAELEDYDLLLSPSRLSELPVQAQFSTDSRTGRPVISTPAALAGVLRCVPEGVILAEPPWWELHGWRAKLAPVLALPGVRHQIRRDDRYLILRWWAEPQPGTGCGATAS